MKEKMLTFATAVMDGLFLPFTGVSGSPPPSVSLCFSSGRYKCSKYILLCDKYRNNFSPTS